MTHRIYWPKTPHPGNVGDLITPWLYEQDTGEAPEWAPPGSAGTIHGCGSIAHLVGPESIGWGSGCMNAGDKPHARADWRAVRGPYTQRALEFAGVTVEALGDPGLLVPRFLPPYQAKHFLPLSIVPHYVDGERVRAFSGDRCARIVSPLQTVGGFASKVWASEYVASSSLHGVIIAHAYGIPAVWCEFSSSVLGDGHKFRDYFASVGLEGVKPWNLRARDKPLTLEEVKERAVLPKTMPDLDALWEARPWKT